MKKFKRYATGEDLLHGVHQEMSKAVPRSKQVRRSGTVPKNIINGYLKDVETVHDIAYGESGSKHKIELLKKFYYSKYVLKELPESYVELQKRIAREEGRGNVEVDRDRALKTIQSNQKSSLDEWIDYLNSSDLIYPMWFKNYAFQEMVKIGKFDKEKETFGKRSKSDTQPFVELNSEALAKVYDTVSKLVGKEEKELSEEEMSALAEGNSFKKVYTYYLVQAMKKTKVQGTEGVWVKYEQGENYQELCKSLQGKNTDWCIAGEETAKQYVSQGDFYLYYTKGETGEYTEPRLAIRMDGKDRIHEVKGIESGQNVEGEMTEVLDKKLDEFQDKEAYRQRLYDMKLLTKIEKKQNNGEDLSKEEIRFLYEIDGKIQGFGWEADPRIEEIRNRRDVAKDLANVFECKEDEILIKSDEGSKVEAGKKIVACYGDLNEEDFTRYDTSDLKCIVGCANLGGLTSAEGLESLEIITKKADFNKLTSAKGLEKLKRIGEGAYFPNLLNAEGLSSLTEIGETVHFGKLTSAKGLEKLKRIGKTADFPNLLNAEGLKNLTEIGTYAFFNKLTNAKGLEKLKRIGRNAHFSNLENAEGLKNLTEIGNDAFFYKLTNAKGLEKLKRIGEDAYFPNLLNAEGLNSLTKIGKRANFNKLPSAKGLNNLEEIGADAEFSELTSAKELEKLKRIGGSAYFPNLLNAEGLNNLAEIGRTAMFSRMTSAKGFGKLTIKNEGYIEIAGTDFSSLKNSDGAEGVKIEGGKVIIRQRGVYKEAELKEPTMLTDLIPRSKGAKLKDAMNKSADLDKKIEEAQGLLGKIKQLISEKIRRDK